MELHPRGQRRVQAVKRGFHPPTYFQGVCSGLLSDNKHNTLFSLDSRIPYFQSSAKVHIRHLSQRERRAVSQADQSGLHVRHRFDPAVSVDRETLRETVEIPGADQCSGVAPSGFHFFEREVKTPEPLWRHQDLILLYL